MAMNFNGKQSASDKAKAAEKRLGATVGNGSGKMKPKPKVTLKPTAKGGKDPKIGFKGKATW